MTLIKKVKGKRFSSYVLTTQYESWLFDYPGEVCDGNIILPDVDISLIDRIFVSDSFSLGVLFISVDIPVYITHPVYIQLLHKYELLSKAATKDSNDVNKHIYTRNTNRRDNLRTRNRQNSNDIIDKINIEQFKNNCIFVQYGQCLVFNETRVHCMSSGMYIGWCMYYIDTGCSSLLYFTDVSFINKVCRVVQECKPVYILWNKRDKSTDGNSVRHNITEFNKHVVQNGVLTIEIESPNMCIDLLFHLNFILKKTNKKIKVEESEVKVLQALSLHTDWLNPKYLKLSSLYCNSLFSNDASDIIIKSDVQREGALLHTNGISEIYDLDTSASENGIKDAFGDKLLELVPGMYYNIKDNIEHEDVLVDGSIDVRDNLTYLIGEVQNTDFFNLNAKCISVSHVNILNDLFRKEKFIKKDNVYIFFRLGIQIKTTQSGRYEMSRYKT